MVKGLYHWNYIEELGIGVDRMIRVMAEAGNPPPEFSTTGHTVTVTLRSALAERLVALRERLPEGLHERQVKALLWVQERGSINNREYRDLCGVSNKTAYAELTELVRKGLLRASGEGRARVYRLSPSEGNDWGNDQVTIR